jgi:hypothetical protein
LRAASHSDIECEAVFVDDYTNDFVIKSIFRSVWLRPGNAVIRQLMCSAAVTAETSQRTAVQFALVLKPKIEANNPVR